MEFKPSRTEALARLKHFSPRAGRDCERYRDYDYGPSVSSKCIKNYSRGPLANLLEGLARVG